MDKRISAFCTRCNVVVASSWFLYLISTSSFSFCISERAAFDFSTSRRCAASFSKWDLVICVFSVSNFLRCRITNPANKLKKQTLYMAKAGLLLYQGGLILNEYEITLLSR